MTAHIPHLSHYEMALRIGLAALFGAAVGLEREWRDRAAGLRTHMLVCIGSALFTIISAYSFEAWYQFEQARGSGQPAVFVSDPGRIAAQIVSGIGFLGAGAIWRSSGSTHGLTTAATLWAMAAIGMAVGIGEYALSSMAVAAILFVLLILRALARTVREFGHPARMVVEVRVATAKSVKTILQLIKTEGGQVKNLNLGSGTADGGRTVTFEVVGKAGLDEAKIVEGLAGLEGIYHLHVADIEGHFH